MCFLFQLAQDRVKKMFGEVCKDTVGASEYMHQNVPDQICMTAKNKAKILQNL